MSEIESDIIVPQPGSTLIWSFLELDLDKTIWMSTYNIIWAFASQMKSYLKEIQRCYLPPPTALKTKNEEPSPIREMGSQHSVTSWLCHLFVSFPSFLLCIIVKKKKNCNIKVYTMWWVNMKRFPAPPPPSFIPKKEWNCVIQLLFWDWLANFNYTTVLSTTVIMLYIRSWELNHLISEKFIRFYQSLPISSNS